jgi:hypothetical protein
VEDIVMVDQSVEYKEELLRQIERLPAEKIKEVLDFACFISAKDSIDPSQAYFWTQKWQTMEAEADQDKEKGKVLGDGTVDGLMRELKG